MAILHLNLDQAPDQGFVDHPRDGKIAFCSRMRVQVTKSAVFPTQKITASNFDWGSLRRRNCRLPFALSKSLATATCPGIPGAGRSYAGTSYWFLAAPCEEPYFCGS